ncbi:MAG: phage tail tape measure protein, partial [Actinobacteria bacterium]
MATQTFRIKVIVDPSGAGRGVRTVNKELDKTAKKAGAVGAALKRAFLFLGGGVALFGGIKLLASFSQEMSTVKAITQATGVEFAMLTEEAKRLGTETRFSASQAAQGMVSLARAGFDANETLMAVEGTLKLAQAGALDLGQAAD